MSKLIIKKQYSPEPRDIYFTVPNFISLLRIISIPLIAMLVARHEMVSALVVLALSAVSDGLDGLIARSGSGAARLWTATCAFRRQGGNGHAVDRHRCADFRRHLVELSH